MAPDKPLKNRRPWWVRLILYLIPLWIILAIVLSVEISGRRAYNRAMQEAKLDGPVTFEEIEVARKTWPDDQNGARIILRLEPRLDAIGKEETTKLLPIVGDADWPPLGHRWSDTTDVSVNDFLRRTSAELDEINHLTDCKGGRFPLDTKADPIDILLPEYHNLRFSAKLKMLQAMSRAVHEDNSRMVEDVICLLRHGQLVADDPRVISALVRTAITDLAVSTVERGVALAPVSVESLKRLDQEFASQEQTDSMSWGLRGERAFIVALVDQVSQSGGFYSRNGTEREFTNMPRIGFRGWFLANMAVCLRMDNRLVRARNDAGRLEAAAENEADLSSMSQYYTLSRMLVASFSRAFTLSLRDQGYVRCARLALAAERYRIDEGRFPHKAADLVPGYLDAVPLDPFDDKPLRYRVDPDAVIIYSIGENKVDDGGKVQSRAPHKCDMPDWGFVLLKPELRGRPPASTAPAATQTSPAELLSPTGG